MWRRIANIALAVFIWAAIAAYVIYSAILVSRHNQEQNVERLNIEIVDSTAKGQLITSQRVREMLLERGIATINTNVDRVDTKAIKSMICDEGFVDRVGIYASYSGTLHIRISQRKPLFRLMCNGYNCYITADGYIFSSPEHAALHVPVVSGSYTPLFESEYEGTIEDVLAAHIAAAEEQIRTIGRGAAPILERQEFWVERRKAVRDSTIAERAERKRLYRYIDGHLRDCRNALEDIATQQRVVEQQIAKTRSRFSEFMRFIEFIAHIESDRFWRAEVVQIVTSTTSDGRLAITLIPRSGNHRILFGDLDRWAEKMAKLHIFYDKVAPTCGWDSYKTVDLSYADTIVCTYNEEN